MQTTYKFASVFFASGLNSFTSEVNSLTSEVNSLTYELGRLTSELGSLTSELGRLTSELGCSTSELGYSTSELGYNGFSHKTYKTDNKRNIVYTQLTTPYNQHSIDEINCMIKNIILIK